MDLFRQKASEKRQRDVILHEQLARVEHVAAAATAVANASAGATSHVLRRGRGWPSPH